MQKIASDAQCSRLPRDRGDKPARKKEVKRREQLGWARRPQSLRLPSSQEHEERPSADEPCPAAMASENAQPAGDCPRYDDKSNNQLCSDALPGPEVWKLARMKKVNHAQPSIQALRAMSRLRANNPRFDT